MEPVFDPKDEEDLARIKQQLEARAGGSDQLADVLEKGTLPVLVRGDGSPVPSHWPVFKQGEHVVIKDYTFRVAYLGESVMLLEPVGVAVIGREGGGG
jgi:hypothetical protein